MSEIRPFQALRYNQDKIKNLAKVVCPPYDVISPSQQQSFLDSDPHNLIHILLGKDVAGEDKYIRAGNYFNTWIKEGVLVKEEKPAIYFYSQTYNLKGEKKTRYGFIALLRLEDKDSAVFKHEHTRLEPKQDRLKLVWQVKANLSPIFAVFSDHKRIIRSIFQKQLKDKAPDIDIVDTESIEHKVWKIDSEELLKRVEASMKSEDIFIADGHHRYEVACTYRDEMKKKLGVLTGKEGFNYVMAYFTNTEPYGLTIMAINRLVKLPGTFDQAKFDSTINEYFYVEEIKDKTKFFFLLQKAGNAEHVVGMYKDKKFWLLRLKNVRTLDKIITDKPKVYRSLDVSILNYIILKMALSLDIEDKQNIEFNHNSEELIEKCNADKSNIAFFLNPVKIEQIMSVALAGEKMPSKSTYFYPKVLSGLVINKF